MGCKQPELAMKKVWTSPGLPGTWLLTSLLLPGAAISAQTGQAIGTDYPPVEILDKALEFRQFGRVEITGSSIVRKEQTQALPVISLTREELRRAGIKSVSEALQKLPMMGNFSDLSQTEIVGGGYANAVVHGVQNGTLVLVNGRRLAPFGRQTMAGPERSGYDLNTLPLSDVDRIEVLSDGASSLYGTDAIAGVINIIMRDERQGFEVSVDHIRPERNTGQGQLLSLGWGKGKLSKDGYSFLLTTEWADRRALTAARRPEYALGQYTLTHEGQPYAVEGSWVTDRTSPGTLYSPASSTAPARWDNDLSRDGVCLAGHVPSWGQAACKYNQYGRTDLYPEQKSQRLRAKAQWAAFEGSTAFAELVYGQHDDLSATRLWPVLAQAVSVNPDATDHLQAVALGFDPTRTQIRWRPDLPLLNALRTQKNWNMALGLKGVWQDWDYRLQAYRSQSNATRLLETVSYKSLGLLPNDQLLSPLATTNPLTAALQSLRSPLTPMDTGTTQLDALEWRSSRPLMELNGRDVAVGVGLDIRRESTVFVNTAAASNIQPSFNASRSVVAAYAELQIPVTSNWEVNTALRQDRYNDVGASTNGKLSSRWVINAQWAMRGSLGTGFRAPVVGQTQSVGNGFPFAQTAFANPCTASLVSLAQTLRTPEGATGVCDPTNMVVYGNGNPDLKPEKSLHTNWGLAFTPHANWRLSMDYWRTGVKDTIRYASDTAAVNGPLNPDYFRLDAAGKLALYLPMVNLGEVQKSGLDLEAQWRYPSDWGQLQIRGLATYMLTSRQRVLLEQPWTSDLGRYSVATDTVVPRWRSRWVFSWTRQDWDSHVVFNYTSAYVDATVTGLNLLTLQPATISNRRVSSFSTVDWTVRHRLTPSVDLRLGVANLLNAKAPLSFAQTSLQVFGVNTVYSQMWGRTLELGVTARF